MSSLLKIDNMSVRFATPRGDLRAVRVIASGDGEDVLHQAFVLQRCHGGQRGFQLHELAFAGAVLLLVGLFLALRERDPSPRA